MKPLLSLFLLLSLLPAGVRAGEPELTITTPAIVRGQRPAVLSGTATDTAETTAPVAAAGVREVLYQYEGDKRWRKAVLTATDAATVTWAVTLEVEGARGRRIYFRAVDIAGNESDIRGLRFRRGS